MLLPSKKTTSRFERCLTCRVVLVPDNPLFLLKFYKQRGVYVVTLSFHRGV